MIATFLNGCAIGLSIAAPVGPIGVLCIRRSLDQGARTGFFTGLGAAAADGFYGAVAAFGLTLISNFLVEHQTILRIIGGTFLAYLGLKTFFSKPAAKPATTSTDATAFTSTFFLTLTNPMTIIQFIGIFVGLGVTTQTNYTAATLITAGVFLGSAIWWLFLSHAAAHFRSRITPNWMQNINRLSAAIILAYAVKAFWPIAFRS